ncbi:MAG TPA: methyltransferase [Candidatus Acidoferrales bacterium]|nr:methyltransferase [Candidatus Acidoferrales bacterium]
MSLGPDFFTRLRVRLAYPTALAVFWFARPIPLVIILGALIGGIGLCIRASAAGYLRKQETLAIAGPYAYTRNPLYLGSGFLMAGLALAAYSWISAVLSIGYFTVFYVAVMRREEEELRRRFGSVFEEYARAVPIFFPSLTPSPRSAGSETFSWSQYRKNREYRATVGFLFILGLLVLIWAFRLA